MVREVLGTPESAAGTGEVLTEPEIYAVKKVDPHRFARVIGGFAQVFERDNSAIIRLPGERRIFALHVLSCNRGKEERVGNHRTFRFKGTAYDGGQDFAFGAVAFWNNNREVDLIAEPYFSETHPHGVITWQTITRNPAGSGETVVTRRLDYNSPALPPHIAQGANLARVAFEKAPPLEPKRYTR
ncbi:MAG: hypothetical protein HY431_01630 [Candidatus Levybacteria bacterium]|nr:hypothetical protein [Candidatus Levybacteria bacterium]